MTFLGKVCAALSDAGVRYAIVGGHAVALHGAVRGTVDVDVAIRWTRRSLEKAQVALEGLGLQSRLPITAEDVFQFRDEYVRNRKLIAWNFVNSTDPSEMVDLMVDYDLKGKRTRKVATIDGPIVILSRTDLVRMKKKSGRPQDLEDVRALERLP